MEEAGCQRLQKPGDHLERSEQSPGGALVVGGALQADRLVVEDLDPLVHGVVDEALQRAAVHLAEELAGVVRVLGEDDEGVVVQKVALDRLVLTGESFALLHLLLKHLLQPVIVDLGADHCGGSFDPVLLFEDGVSSGHLCGPTLPDVKGNGEKKTVGVVPLVVEGNCPLVPFLVYPVVLKDSEMPWDEQFCEESSIEILCFNLRLLDAASFILVIFFKMFIQIFLPSRQSASCGNKGKLHSVLFEEGLPGI